MRRIGCFGSVAAFCMLAAPVVRAAPLQLSIEEAVARARTASVDLNSTRKDLDVATTNLERSHAWLPSNPYFSSGAQSTTQSGVGPNYFFLLSQQFEVAGQRGVRMAAAQAGVEKAAAETQNADLVLMATVKTTFIQAQVNAQRVDLARQGLEAAHRLSSELSERRVTTEMQRLDLNVALIQESRARRDLSSAERARETSFNSLRRLVGVAPDQELSLSGAPQSSVRPAPPLAELLDRALRQRPDLVALQHAVKNAELQLDLTKREGIPNVTVSGTVSRFEGDTLAGGDVSVPVPIFQSNAPNVHDALAERQHAGFEAQQLESTIQEEVRDARAAFVDAGTDLETLQRDILPKSEENFEIEQRQFERGTIGVSDLVGIQIDLITARRDYLDAIEGYNEALITLERVVGGLL